ncbi:MAG: PKD domain-containing protein [Bacteroidales bacterium]|nr:PKD domain-containing protein [Bacteroidales bacterium]
MKKVLYFLAAAVFAVAMAACSKPAAGGDENTPGGEQTAASPKADFDYAVDGLKVTFTNKSTNATAYKWDFGDDETSKEANPEHTYAAGGSYSVKLTAANADGEVSSKEVRIDVAGAPKAYFTFEAKKDRAGEFGRVINFDATSSQNATNITWDFGDGSTTEPGTDFKTSHTYADYGKYTVKAVVVNSASAMDTYETEVDVIAYNELLKGGSMEEDDAQYWTVKSANASLPDDGYAGTEGVPSFTSTFGYTEDGPSGGNGGCLRLGGENQYHDWAHNVTVYQAIDLEAGDIVQFSAQLKWEGDINNSGLFWLNVAKGEPTPADENILVQFFNYWGEWKDDEGVMHYGPSVPAYDGDLSGSTNYAQGDDWGFSSPVDALGEGTGVCYTAEESGTYYVIFELRNVWSATYWGKPYYIDEVSAKYVGKAE